MDSDDSDIFVEYQRKPVNNLTMNDCIKIKNNQLVQSRLPFRVQHVDTKCSLANKQAILKNNDTGTAKKKLSHMSMKTNENNRPCPNENNQIKHKTNQIEIANLVNNPHKLLLKSGITKDNNENNISLERTQSWVNQSCFQDDGNEKIPHHLKSGKIPNTKSNEEILKLVRPNKAVGHTSINQKITSPVKKPIKLSLCTPKKQANSFKSSPNKSITDYFSPLRDIVKNESTVNSRSSKTKQSSSKALPLTPDNKSESNIGCDLPEKITLSPAIKRRRNNFKAISTINGTESSPSKSPKKKIGSTKLVKRNLFHVPSFSSDNNMSQPTDNYPNLSNGTEADTAFDAKVFNMMIDDVMSKQLLLKQNNVDVNTPYDSLLSGSDLKALEKYLVMNWQSQTLYVRMFFRRKGWHRVSDIKYGDLSPELTNELTTLLSRGFFINAIEKEDIRTQLGLLKKPEIGRLSKNFNTKADNKSQKNQIIESLIANSKQKTVLDMFKSSEKSSRVEQLGMEARTLLGPCFRLEEKHRTVFNRIILIFSLFHNVTDEKSRASSQRLLLQQVLANSLRFIPYVVAPIIVFSKRKDFLEYEKAINMRQEFEEALEAKSYTLFQAITDKARKNFMKLCSDDSYCEEVAKMPTFLSRYSAGNVYASILTHFCENFKRENDSQKMINILSDLLKQSTFSKGARGKWYELLSQVYHSSGSVELAAKVILVAEEDELVDEVRKLSLHIKGKLLLNLKKNKMKCEQIRESLGKVICDMVQEPSRIEINGKTVSGNVQGSKLVYVQDTASGKHYSSVEEQGIYHYKANGFTQGIHAEGYIVSTIYCLFFFDLIYSPNVAGVLQSSFQERPLDLTSSAFYLNRKEEIDERLKDMMNWTASDVAVKIESVFAEYMDYSCVISWKEYLTPKLLCDIVDCIGMPHMIKICERFIFKPRIAYSGFPDLTLWNPVTKKCKFVEVKSPKDRLSSKQRIWLAYLKQNGIDCEVCDVKNTASKRIRKNSQ